MNILLPLVMVAEVPRAAIQFLVIEIITFERVLFAHQLNTFCCAAQFCYQL
jgi:hypothetical protein